MKDHFSEILGAAMVITLLISGAVAFHDFIKYRSSPDVVQAEAHQKELLEKQRCPTCHRLPER